MKKQRIQSIDALRGLAVVLMVVHHFLFDLYAFLEAPRWLFYNPVFNVLHYVFAVVFIGLSGVSSRFSRSNIRRGVIVLAIALAMSLVTWFLAMPIRFGVLHLLGVSMIFYGITHKMWEGIPDKLMPVLCVLLIILSLLAVNFIRIDSEHLWMFGWYTEDFYSADYFPMLPWLFVFLFGTWVGKHVREGHLPERFYAFSVPFFPQVGRKALIIYIVHQPILYGLTVLIGLILY